MKLKNLACAFAIGISMAATPLPARAAEPLVAGYECKYNLQQTYYEIDEKGSEFSVRIVDSNLDKKAGSVRIIHGEHDALFIRHEPGKEDSVRDVQLFDIADRIIDYLSSDSGKRDSEKYASYMNLIKKRFIKSASTDNKSRYNFDSFFSEGFKPQETIEDLISYSYVKYSGLVRKAKKENPDETLQNMINNSSLIDKIRFILLSMDYGNNLGKLGYRVDGDFFVNKDYMEISLIDKKGRSTMPRMKIEINMDSSPEYIDMNEIRKFLGEDKPIFSYDPYGNYIFGAFKYK